MQMVLWGFITVFLVSHSSWVAQASGVLISGVLLWDVLFRGQLGVSLVFMEEMWSRNLGHLFVSPLRPMELAAALLVMSLIRTFIGVGGAALIAIPLFHFSIFDLGLPLLAFFANLIVMGWAIGLLVSGIVLRYGLGAESMAWIAIFAVQPISGVYYPIEVLPGWLQIVAHGLPSSHVFEGMRAVLFEQRFRVDLLVNAMALNVFILAGGYRRVSGVLQQRARARPVIACRRVAHMNNFTGFHIHQSLPRINRIKTQKLYDLNPCKS